MICRGLKNLLLACANIVFVLPAISATVGKFISEPGFVIYRDINLSDNKFSGIIEFKNFMDRRAEYNPSKGYIALNKNGETINIFSEQIIEIVYNSEINPTNIKTDSDIELYKSRKQRLMEASSTNQNIRSYLDPCISVMEENIEKFNMGNVLQNGIWVSKKEIREKEETAEEQEKLEKIRMGIIELISNIASKDMISSIRKQITNLEKMELKYAANQKLKNEIEVNLTKQLDAAKSEYINRVEAERQKNLAAEQALKARMEYAKQLQRAKEEENEKQKKLQSLGL